MRDPGEIVSSWGMTFVFLRRFFDGTAIQPISQTDRPGRVVGKRNIARGIFEDTNARKLQLAGFDIIFCGSNWTADITRKATRCRVEVIFEDIDPRCSARNRDPESSIGQLHIDAFAA
jgi:hypothetical protein